MNAIQYIQAVNRNAGRSNTNYLVSGNDPAVRQIVANYAVTAAYEKRDILFIIDQTQSRLNLSSFSRSRVLNPIYGSVNLCDDPLDVSSFEKSSFLRALLMELGFDTMKAMKVIEYLNFVRETENRLGNGAPLNVSVLQEYGSPALVRYKLQQLLDRGMTEANFEYLLGRFCEISSAAADFEYLLGLLSPYFGKEYSPTAGDIIHLQVGRFSNDRPMRIVLCKMLLNFVSEHTSDCTVIIFDDGGGDRTCVINILKSLPTTVNVHMFTNDAFSYEDEGFSLFTNIFNVRIYSRHENMKTCAKIEEFCGQVDTVKRSYTTTIDKRIRSASAFDMLLGRNKTESETRNTPVREPRIRKEKINSLSPGVAVIDCAGEKTLFQF